MDDRAATPDSPADLPRDETPDSVSPGPAPADGNHHSDSPSASSGPDHTVAALEERVRSLEETVAALKDTRKLEDRLVERVTRRVERKQPASAIQAPTAALANAGKHLVPVAVAAVQAQANAADAQISQPGSPWLIVDIYSELRAMLRMFLDARYRVFYMTWQTKVFPPVLLGIMVLCWLWLASLPLGFLSTILDKMVELLLAFFLYKVLSREARRYRELKPLMQP
jgi:hypothetical protein